MTFDGGYYAQVYRNYELQNPPHKLRFYHEVVRRLVPEGAPSVHDLGCAFGHFIGTAPSAWVRSASDASEYAVASARERYPDVAFAVASGLRHGDAEQFDVVTAFDVLEHVPQLEETLAEIARRLREGGYLVTVVPVYDGPLGPIVRMLDRDPTHVYRESRAFWATVLAKEFTIVARCGITRYLLPGSVYAHVPAAWTYGFAPAVAWVCRKTRGCA